MVTGVSPVLEAFIPKMSPLSVRRPGWRLSQCSSIQKDISATKPQLTDEWQEN
jgi:hypothetical protein